MVPLVPVAGQVWEPRRLLLWLRTASTRRQFLVGCLTLHCPWRPLGSGYGKSVRRWREDLVFPLGCGFANARFKGWSEFLSVSAPRPGRPGSSVRGARGAGRRQTSRLGGPQRTRPPGAPSVRFPAPAPARAAGRRAAPGRPARGRRRAGRGRRRRAARTSGGAAPGRPRESDGGAA